MAFAGIWEHWQSPEGSELESCSIITTQANATLALDNRFTEEAIAFALNQQLALLKAEALEDWLAGRRVAASVQVAVLNPGNIPFVGLQDWLAVTLAGHRYAGSVSSRSPHLLPAFVSEVQEEAGYVWSLFGEVRKCLDTSSAVIASGDNETMEWLQGEAAQAGIAPEHCLLRGHRNSVAVIDGKESAAERERLAEDALLHEGRGCRNVAIIWAPESISPDPYLDAMAQFRGVFPAHPALPGSLKMQQAFLAAVDTPHGYADDLSFLVSKGPPEPQDPGHVRWTGYDALDEVNDWLSAHEAELQHTFATERLLRGLETERLSRLGEGQRPLLSWCPDGVDTMAFLASIEPG